MCKYKYRVCVAVDPSEESTHCWEWTLGKYLLEPTLENTRLMLVTVVLHAVHAAPGSFLVPGGGRWRTLAENKAASEAHQKATLLLRSLTDQALLRGVRHEIYLFTSRVLVGSPRKTRERDPLVEEVSRRSLYHKPSKPKPCKPKPCYLFKEVRSFLH